MHARREILDIRAKRVLASPEHLFGDELLTFFWWLVKDPFMSAHLDSLVNRRDMVRESFDREAAEVREGLREVLQCLWRDKPSWLGHQLSGTEPSPTWSLEKACASFRDPSALPEIAAAVRSFAAAYDAEISRKADPDLRHVAIMKSARALCERLRVADHHDHAARRAVPSEVLATIIEHCRRTLRAPEGTATWLDRIRIGAGAMLLAASGEPSGDRLPARDALSILVDELHTSMLTTLDRLTVVARFAQRAVMYDAPRLRGFTTEEELTRELATYLHDQGILALQVALGERRPDLLTFGSQGFAVESKLLTDDGKTRPKVLRGFWQLHNYLTLCAGGHVDVDEGVVVLFRTGGASVEVPASVHGPRFTLHCQVIDIGPSSVTGSRQPQPVVIEANEILECVAANSPPDPEGNQRSGTQQAGASASTMEGGGSSEMVTSELGRD